MDAVPVLESPETEEVRPVFAEEEFPSEDMDDITEEVSIKAEEVPTKPELKVAFNTKNSGQPAHRA